jgi:hypothetical protein
LALRLIQRNGHRVRIATHDTFKSFVLEQKQVLKGWKDREGRSLEDKLEFFGVGGDPKELMAYMVKSEHSCRSTPGPALMVASEQIPAFYLDSNP